MGLTGKSRLERLLSGNDTFEVSDESNYPVLLGAGRSAGFAIRGECG
jgi:hypothetical protein